MVQRKVIARILYCIFCTRNWIFESKKSGCMRGERCSRPALLQNQSFFQVRFQGGSWYQQRHENWPDQARLLMKPVSSSLTAAILIKFVLSSDLNSGRLFACATIPLKRGSRCSNEKPPLHHSRTTNELKRVFEKWPLQTESRIERHRHITRVRSLLFVSSRSIPLLASFGATSKLGRKI
jgi:hypothetical protein